jgi:SPP1 family predicted phage head-tail adaptor
MALRAGRLNKRVVIEQSTPAQDEFGEEVDSWAAIPNGTRWAAVDPLTGTERFAAQQVNPRVSHRVTIRYMAGVTAKMRVLYGSRVLEIDAALNPEERGEYLELLCTENPSL